MSEFVNPIAEANSPDSGEITKPDIAYVAMQAGMRLFCPDHDCPDPERVLIPKQSAKGNYFSAIEPIANMTSGRKHFCINSYQMV